MSVADQDILTFVQDNLRYNQDTGEIFWTRNRTGGIKAGSKAGFIRRKINKEYMDVSCAGKLYRVHRIIWLLVYGEWPKDEIDHINGNGLDNRLCNLREATRSQNSQNCLHPWCADGFKGTSWHKARKKWYARIKYQGKSIHLGVFPSIEEAHAAYAAKAKELHGEFMRLA